MSVDKHADLNTPFPLKKQFVRKIIPGLVIFIITLTGLGLIGIDNLVKFIYLELAQIRAEALAKDIEELHPDDWKTYITSPDPMAFLATPAGGVLFETLNKVSKDSRVRRFRLYNRVRQVLYSEIAVSMGTREDLPDLDPVFRQHIPQLVSKKGANYYELYAPLLDEKGNLLAVFEIYESKVFLDKLLLNSMIPALAVPTVLFCVLLVWLWRLMVRAQKDIDRRTSVLASLRQRLERFVSTHAVDAALDANDSGEVIPPERVATTLLYSDIRQFTSLAENNPPRKTIEFLNEVMSVQVKEINRFDGDVDKMIGDAVLARFDGPDAETRAINASMEIQKTMHQGTYIREIGIGIYSGNVISCTIGTEYRHDFTIIGDAVNVSARLCSAAEGGQIVVDGRTVRQSDFEMDTFSGAEDINMKGREQGMSVHRWTVESGAAEEKTKG